MFQQPQATEEEIRIGEAEANASIQMFLGTAVMLYLSPFVVNSALSFF